MDPDVATTGVFVVQEHSRWSDPDQLFVGKVTIEVNTPAGSYRREFEVTAADIISFAAQIINLLTTAAQTYLVPVLPNNSASFDALAAATTAAQAGWAPS